MAFGFITKPFKKVHRTIRSLWEAYRTYRTVKKAIDQLKKEGQMPETGGVATVPVKSAWYSKINWTQVVAVVASVGAFFGLDTSEEVKAQVVLAIQAVGSAITLILRTYFNRSVTPE